MGAPADPDAGSERLHGPVDDIVGRGPGEKALKVSGAVLVKQRLLGHVRQTEPLITQVIENLGGALAPQPLGHPTLMKTGSFGQRLGRDALLTRHGAVEAQLIAKVHHQ